MRASSLRILLLLVAIASGSGFIDTAGAQAACPVGSVQLSGTLAGGDASGQNVCIAGGTGAVMSGAESWNSVTVDGTLQVGAENGCQGSQPYGLTLANGGSVDTGGRLDLWSSSSCNGGGATSLTVTAGTLTNAGTIAAVITEPCGSPPTTCTSQGPRTITGNLTNTGTVTAAESLVISGPGIFENRGVLSSTGTDYEQPGASSIVIQGAENLVNDTGATIKADMQSGTPNQIVMHGGVFTQGAGTVSATAFDNTTANPRPVSLVGTTLDYTGAGSGTIEFDPGTGGRLEGALQGNQTLIIAGGGGCPGGAATPVSTSGNVSSAGTIRLQPNCGAPQLSVAAGTTLTNTGSIDAVSGSGESTPGQLNGDVVNQGTISVTGSMGSVGPGTLDNRGAISITGGTQLSLSGGEGFTSGSGGSLTTDANSSSGLSQSGGTFTQGAGTASGNPISLQSTALVFSGGGAAAFVMTGSGGSLAGTSEPGQSLRVIGGGCGSQDARVAVPAGFTNGGAITLDGAACGTGSHLLVAPGHTLANTGTISTCSCHGGGARELGGQLTNAGSLQLDDGAQFDTTGTTLTQTAGTTTIPGGRTLDLAGSTGTFQLQGGVLDGTGTLTGSLANTGGNAIAGAVGAPGHLTISGSYTQGPGATLTAVIDGTTAGSGYGQLATGGATLAGTLAIDTVPGFTPSAGDVYRILTGTTSGTFAALTGQFPPGAGIGYSPGYDAGGVTLSAQTARTLTVSKLGAGTGTVTSTPAGVDCGSSCSARFLDGATVTLTAAAATGSTFAGWSGDCAGSGTACQLTMSQAREVGARFVAEVPPTPRPHATAITLSASAARPVTGQLVLLRAKVSPAPDGGTVRFASHSAAIPGCGAVAVSHVTGSADCRIVFATPGPRRLHVSYSGDTRFAGSGSPVLRLTTALSESLRGRPMSRHAKITLELACAPRSGGCATTITLRTTGRHSQPAGTRALRIAAGRSESLTIGLDARDARALARLGRLPVGLAIVLTVRGSRTTVARRALTLTR